MTVTAQGSPLELPAVQEPELVLESGTEKGQSHCPAVVTILGTEHSTVAKGSPSIPRLLPAIPMPR